jgi:hypothetical protein
MSIMPNSRLYGIWKQRLEQWLPVLSDLCVNMLMLGLYQAQTAHLHHIARRLPVRAQKLSRVKRLGCFLVNEVVDVQAWYHPGPVGYWGWQAVAAPCISSSTTVRSVVIFANSVGRWLTNDGRCRSWSFDSSTKTHAKERHKSSFLCNKHRKRSKICTKS